MTNLHIRVPPDRIGPLAYIFNELGKEKKDMRQKIIYW